MNNSNTSVTDIMILVVVVLAIIVSKTGIHETIDWFSPSSDTAIVKPEKDNSALLSLINHSNAKDSNMHETATEDVKNGVDFFQGSYNKSDEQDMQDYIASFQEAQIGDYFEGKRIEYKYMSKRSLRFHLEGNYVYTFRYAKCSLCMRNASNACPYCNGDGFVVDDKLYIKGQHDSNSDNIAMMYEASHRRYEAEVAIRSGSSSLNTYTANYTPSTLEGSTESSYSTSSNSKHYYGTDCPSYKATLGGVWGGGCDGSGNYECSRCFYEKIIPNMSNDTDIERKHDCPNCGRPHHRSEYHHCKCKHTKYHLDV